MAGDVAGRVAASRALGHRTLVLGGGHARAGTTPAPVSVDGGPDLCTPRTRVDGNLDAMGPAHLLARPGTVPEVAAVGPSVPLLTPADVVVYGDSLPPGDHERDLVGELGLTCVPAEEVHADPAAAAARARAVAEAAARTFVVHFDVDVLAVAESPLADVPEPVGLTLAEAMTGVAGLVASPRCAGVSVTEINPDHLPEPETLPRFVRALTAA